jgi:hypothetical protein
MSKIFVRERARVEKGAGQPRFAIVGVQGTDLKFFQMHVRRSELEAIAQATGAEIVHLPRGGGEHAQEGGGEHRRRGRRKHGSESRGGDASPA